MKAAAQKGRPNRRASRAALAAVAYGVTIFLLLPTLVIAPMSVGPERYLRFPPNGFSMRWYAAYFSDQDWINATLFSIEAGVIATMSATAIGTMLALALARGRLPGKGLIELLVIGPVIVPHVALAVAMFLVFEQLRLTGTLIGFAMAHTILALPFVVFTVLAALYRFDPDLERAALSCGASPFRAFRHVTLPIIAPGVISAALFAFIISFDEAVVSFFISDLDRKTLPRKMFEDIDYNISPTLAAVATMLTLVTIVALIASHIVSNRMERRTTADGA
ncbi:ABC transporter permease [Bradyrhizobium sp. LHD-71]|uniref:ABC transporter permease n=1 Tax=Bradyrhizobium sp. LHD-71 TaxID=3072141 RepID=UPI00280FACF0|nr:ABC transporter permease [Bradyrhizobium sp. LHD-71]MDQ8728495.1 ABC transporter permease [Bradyrhizobium sp. LHD-71]